VSISINS